MTSASTAALASANAPQAVSAKLTARLLSMQMNVLTAAPVLPFALLKLLRLNNQHTSRAAGEILRHNF